MRLSSVWIASLLSLVFASDAFGQDNSAQTDAEREFMSWNSSLPPRTVDGYHTALYCNVANEVAQVIAERAGDQGASHRYDLGSEKSWIFAHRLADQLGLIESSHGAADSAEIRKLTHDDAALHDAISQCRDVGLVRDKAQAAIDQKFVQWSSNWMVDMYRQGSAQIESMNCGSDGCVAQGHFSFSRGGQVLTIPFTAQIPSAGDNEYSLGRLCYNDTTTGMRDCAD